MHRAHHPCQRQPCARLRPLWNARPHKQAKHQAHPPRNAAERPKRWLISRRFAIARYWTARRHDGAHARPVRPSFMSGGMAQEGAASRAPSASFSSTAAALDKNADLTAARCSELVQSCRFVGGAPADFVPFARAQVAWRGGVAWRRGVARSEPPNPLGPSGNVCVRVSPRERRRETLRAGPSSL